MTTATVINRATSRESILAPLAILLVSRGGLIVLTYLGLALMPEVHNTRNVLPGNLLFNGWTRWDADWYARIAANGYTNKPIDASGQRDTAFFPLYPLLVRVAGLAIHDNDIGGWLVSNIAFIIAGLFFHQLVQIRWDRQVAQRALILLCVYPFSFFFTAIYTESIFLLCSAAAFWFGEKRRWLPATLFAAAAGATRVVGAATAIAVALMYLQTAGWNRRNIRNALGWLLLGLTGLIAFIVFLWCEFREPLAFVSAQKALGWQDLNSWQTLRQLYRLWITSSFGALASGNVPLIEALNLGMIAVAVPLTAIAWRKLPVAYSAWTTILLLMSVFRWASFGRMVCVLFPLFIVAAILLRDRRLYHGIVYLSTILLALLTLLFTHALWVA